MKIVPNAAFEMYIPHICWWECIVKLEILKAIGKQQTIIFSTSDISSDVLLLSKVRFSVKFVRIGLSGTSASLTDLSYPIRLLGTGSESLICAREVLCERGRALWLAETDRTLLHTASLAQIGLSRTQPLPLTHVICLSQSESTASLAHGLSRDLCERVREVLGRERWERP